MDESCASIQTGALNSRSIGLTRTDGKASGAHRRYPIHVGHVEAVSTHEKKNDKRAQITTNDSIITKHVVKLAWVLASVSRLLIDTFLSVSATLPEQNGTCSGSSQQTNCSGPTCWGIILFKAPVGEKKLTVNSKKMTEGRYETRSPCCCCYGCSSHHRLLGGSFCIHSKLVCFVPAASEPQLHPSVCSLTMLLSPKHPPHVGSFSVQYRSHSSSSTPWFSQQMLLVARVSVWASASLMLPLSAARYLLTSLLRKSV